MEVQKGDVLRRIGAVEQCLAVTLRTKAVPVDARAIHSWRWSHLAICSQKASWVRDLFHRGTGKRGRGRKGHVPVTRDILYRETATSPIELPDPGWRSDLDRAPGLATSLRQQILDLGKIGMRAAHPEQLKP
jgi:hypothetical protein